MDCDVRGDAKWAVRVGIAAARMGMCDLHNSRNKHQKHTSQRKENPPRLACTTTLMLKTHTWPIYRTLCNLCADRLGQPSAIDPLRCAV
jgi:hypothetical protein